MTAKTMPCAVPGCGRAIRTNSATGVCRNHMHYVGVCACRQCADPEFAAAASERMRKLHADPAHNPLAALTPQQRADIQYSAHEGRLYARTGPSRDSALDARFQRTRPTRPHAALLC